MPNGMRSAITASIALLFATTMACGVDESWTLTAGKKLVTRVETRIEVAGDLRLLDTVVAEKDGQTRQQTTAMPVAVKGQLRYHERELPASGTVLHRAARLYELAEAKLQVGKGEIVSQLGDDRRTIVVQANEELDLFSPAGPLERQEVELLSVTGDSGLLNLLLPTKPVQLGDQWEPAKELLTRWLRIEIVNQSDVTLTLSKVEKGVAIISIAGKVSGGVDGVTTDLELNGKLNFDLAKKCCTWLALNLQEDRAASQGTPGFKTTSQIRSTIAPSELPPELTDAGLADLKTTPDEATRLLRFAAKRQGFELLYEPRWRVVSDQPDLAVMRLIERGDLIAQCNLTRLPPLGAGEQLTLEAFQASLKKSLGTTFGDFIEAGESLSDSGLRVLRVTIAATVSEVPIHYAFYHLSDDHQNRTTLAFTMDNDNVERFGRAEETLVSSFQFIGQPATSEPAKTATQAKNAKPTQQQK